MARDQRLEALRADAQQFGVAQRHQLGGMLDGRAAISDISPTVSPAGDMRHHAALALRVGHEDAQAAGDDQEQRGIILAVALQQRAAGQAEPVGFRQQIACSAASPTFSSSAKALQPFAQLFGIDRLLADAEGGEKRHVHAFITKRSSHHPPSGLSR